MEWPGCKLIHSYSFHSHLLFVSKKNNVKMSRFEIIDIKMNWLIISLIDDCITYVALLITLCTHQKIMHQLMDLFDLIKLLQLF